MNPIMLKTYEDYKEDHKRNKKEFQWHEFLKLDKNQYLNFRASNKSVTLLTTLILIKFEYIIE
jgi:hypothetical protein